MNKIEWTDKTWNVITGCTQISPACDNCYANPNKSRPSKTEWAESIWNQCRKKDVPFFFKQWGNNPNTQRLDPLECCKEFPRGS